MITRTAPLAVVALLATTQLTGCVDVPATGPASPGAAPFPVFAFFQGRSEGRATLKVALRGTVPVRVESYGKMDGATLVLRQTVREGDKPPRDRTWRIRETSPGRYAGTLSDAAGPVTAEASPGQLHIAFRMKGGVDAEQWLTLAADGRSAHNVLKARKFGIVVAALDETIRRL